MPSVMVVGASGYAGALAASILWRHPRFELVAITAREDAGRPLHRPLSPPSRPAQPLEQFSPDLQADAAVVAYPHGHAAPAVAALLERGVRVVDLSADFRLRDVETYERWYVPPPAPRARWPRAVYGLTELYRDAIAGADLVACPGCFPTAAILALAPLASV